RDRMTDQTTNGSATPGGANGTRRELEAGYARASDAMKRKNVRPLIEMTTPDFSQQLLNGQTIPRDRLETTFAEWSAMVKSVDDYSVKIDAINVDGDKAVALTTSTIATTFNDPGGATHRGVSTASTRDTWIRTPNGWLMDRSENLSERTTV